MIDKEFIYDLIESQSKTLESFTYNLNGTSITIDVKKSLTASEVEEIVANVAKNCFDETGYRPEFKQPSLYTDLLRHYCDLECIGEIGDIDVLYKLFYETDIIDNLLEKVGGSQYSDILDAIDDKIEFEKQDRMKPYITEKFFLDLNELIISASDKIASFDFSKIDFSKISESLNGLLSQPNIIKALKNSK